MVWESKSQKKIPIMDNFHHDISAIVEKGILIWNDFQEIRKIPLPLGDYTDMLSTNKYEYI